MTIELSPEMETQLQTVARKRGMAPNRLVLSAVEELLRQNYADESIPRLSKTESELMLKINEGLPART